MKDKNTEKRSKPRAKFYVDKKSRFVHDAVLFMMLSVVFRAVGCWGLWTDRFFTITQILLPIASCLLFILILRFLGDKAFPLTILPVLMGIAFFIIKSLGFDTVLHTVLCIALYVLVGVLYTLTAIGIIRTKWFLVPLFALPFLYHVFVEDLAALRDAANPVLFADGMQELSVLSVMVALIFTALAMKKRKLLEEADLPKIKDPVVIKPAKPQSSAPTLNQIAAQTPASTQTAAPAVGRTEADRGEAIPPAAGETDTADKEKEEIKGETAQQSPESTDKAENKDS